MPQSLAELAMLFDDHLPDQVSFEALASAQPLFAQALGDRLHLEAMHKLLRRNLEEQFEVTPDISSGPFVVLYGSRKTTWAVLRHTGQSRQIYLSPTHTISAKVAGGALLLNRYAVAEQLDLERFDASVRIREADCRLMEAGEIHLKDGKSELTDFQAKAGTPAFSLRVNTVPFGDYEWAFDRATLRAASISGIRQAESNLTTILDLLAAAGSPDSIEHVSRFVDHPMHFVRWKAAQTLFSIDGEAGLGAVRGLEADPHPEIRAAAHRTLMALA